MFCEYLHLYTPHIHPKYFSSTSASYDILSYLTFAQYRITEQLYALSMRNQRDCCRQNGHGEYGTDSVFM